VTAGWTVCSPTIIPAAAQMMPTIATARRPRCRTCMIVFWHSTNADPTRGEGVRVRVWTRGRRRLNASLAIEGHDPPHPGQDERSNRQLGSSLASVPTLGGSSESDGVWVATALRVGAGVAAASRALETAWQSWWPVERTEGGEVANSRLEGLSASKGSEMSRRRRRLVSDGGACGRERSPERCWHPGVLHGCSDDLGSISGETIAVGTRDARHVPRRTKWRRFSDPALTEQADHNHGTHRKTPAWPVAHRPGVRASPARAGPTRLPGGAGRRFQDSDEPPKPGHVADRLAN
jgi:hypothetical protein